jgi:hypothetical protein
MFPFWHDVVAPIIEAAGAKRIVEVGALRGDQTELMLERLGPEVELHVIDPVPFFDPAEHERRFAGRYVFHRDLSVNVLGELAPMDVALIDGDHNWYTVFTELTLLADVARRAGTPMPVMVLHDVAWPYGRRDLYYDPSNIPGEHRQPWRRAGIRRGEPRVLPFGGLNSNLANAQLEGGPRNGVMTAIEDFIGACDGPLRLVVLPIFFGLAIVVAEERLAIQPALAATLDRLEGPEGKDMLLRLSEDIRIDGLLLDHALLGQSGDRVQVLTSRYLEAMKRSILDETQGPALGRAWLDRLNECLDKAWNAFVPGDMAVIGVGSGGSAAFMAAYLEAHDQGAQPDRQRKLWIVDPIGGGGRSDDTDATRELLRRLDLLGDRIHFVPGGAEACRDEPSGPLTVVHVGASAGADATVIVDRLTQRLAAGGIVVTEDSLATSAAGGGP